MVAKVRVLIVDDSTFFRKRIRQELERTGEIEIAGEAANGREAVDMAARLKPDLITMDVAMPLMDGISAVREIMRENPTNIIMFSALTREGARSTMEALDAGAVDFLAKQGGLQGSGDGNGSGTSLSDRVISITRSKRSRRQATRKHAPLNTTITPPPVVRSSGRRTPPPKLVLIGASTGGPVAIQQVLAQLPTNYPYPIVTAVHMPAEFTATFAERLDTVCTIGVKLAEDGDFLRPGKVLIAPGGMQTEIELRGKQMQVKVSAGGSHIYKPSVDLMFSSAARAMREGVLAIVLTGMGADGTQGARVLKESGSSVWSQDQATSVVYGMPYSVAKAGFTDRVLPLEEIGGALSGLA